MIAAHDTARGGSLGGRLSARQALRRWGLPWLALLGLVSLGAAEAASGAAVRAEHVGEQAGIYEQTRTYGATAGDLDGDDRPDLLIVRHYQDFPRVYLNDRPSIGIFEDIHDSAFAEPLMRGRDRHDCPFGDVNGDGRIDIFCTVGGRRGGKGPNPSELWLGTGPPAGPPEFTRSSVAGDFDLGPADDEYGRGRDAAFIDANGDEFPDLYILNAFPRKDGRSGASRLFINEGGMGFRKAPEFDANKVIGSDNLQVVDYDEDGRQDLLVCGKKGVRLLRNRAHTRFVDVTRRAGLGMGCTHALLGEANGRGRPDLFRLGREAFSVHRQRRNGTFTRAVHRRKVRFGDEMAIGSMTRDDRADAYLLRRGSTSSDKPDVMLLNRRRGKRFHKLRIPQVRQGSGDAVTAIDHDLNGLTDVVVMNGHRTLEGPIELLAFYDD